MHADPFRILILLGLSTAVAPGQDPAGDTAPPARFAAPVRLQAGDELLGAGRLYPSPVVHDLDGDGVPDVVVGDLRGMVTVARGERVDDGGLRLGAEQQLKDRRGEQLKFHNW